MAELDWPEPCVLRITMGSPGWLNSADALGHDVSDVPPGKAKQTPNTAEQGGTGNIAENTNNKGNDARR